MDKLFIPNFIIPHLRTDHAGETGAVYIYKGILSVSKDPEIVEFANGHLKTESNHLKLIEDVLSKNDRSKLINVWKLAGFLTGFLPSLLGKNFIYATIYSVESFVETHYENQLKLLKSKGEYTELFQLIEKLKNDEVEHKDEAMNFVKKLNIFHLFWGMIVKIGSLLAVKISKYF